MTPRKRPPLTKKRKEYVENRSSGILVGKPLAYPAGVYDRYQRELDRLVRQMMREYRREISSLWREYSPITTDASLASQAKIALATLDASISLTGTRAAWIYLIKITLNACR